MRMASPSKKSFRGKLETVGSGGALTYLFVPFDVEKTWGTQARVSVKGTLNGFAFQTSLFPYGDGRHHLMVNKAMLEGAKAKPGGIVAVVLEPDAAQHTVAVPADFKQALDSNKSAMLVYNRLSPAKKKEFVAWISGAKTAELRRSRILKAVSMLLAGPKAKPKPKPKPNPR